MGGDHPHGAKIDLHSYNMGVVSFLVKAHLYALAACLLYVGACFLLAHPEAQRHYLFLHNVRFPFFAKYDRPHVHGIERT